MCKVRYVKNNRLFPMICELLERDKRVVITVTGSSMHPFLRENIDRVELSYSSFDTIKRGDIVMAVRENGTYVLHRVINKKEHCFYMIGDAEKCIEGPFYHDQLIAVVTSIWRGKNKISYTNLWWKFLSLLWLRVLPFRGIVFRSYRLIKMLISLKYRGT